MEQRVLNERRGRASDDGFTLVEILIAIVLIGILSAVAVVGIGSLLDRGKASACAAERSALSTAIMAYRTVNDAATIPSDPANGVTPMDTIRLAGLINENSKMYSIEPDGTLTAIAGNSNGCGAVATTDVVPDPDMPPYLGAPGDFSAVAGDGMATFTWTAAPITPNFPGRISRYAVNYTDESGHYEDVACRVDVPDPLTCDVTGLQNGMTYRFNIIVWTQRSNGEDGPGAYRDDTSLLVTPDATNPVVIKGS